MAPAIAALLVGVVSTIAVAVLVAGVERARTRLQFERVADSAVAAVDARMLAQLTLLRGAAGFFEASRDVTDAEFRAYVARLRLNDFYPGVLGVGWTVSLSGEAERAALEAERRRGPFADFRVWPENGPNASAISYLEPLHRRNRAAIGFDMMSEPTRRAAMIVAHRTGEARMSGRVRLVQEIEPVKQPGFLIYVPVYGGALRAGQAPGDRPLRGWIYSPLRAFDLFGAVFAQHDLDNVTVEIYDAAAREDRLLFRHGPRIADPRHEQLTRLDVAGRPWLVRVSSRQGEGAGLVPTVLAAGLLISLLVAALTLQQTRSAMRTEQQVLARTAELRAANERLETEANAREEAEEMVRQMHRMEAVGQLTGGIAHDFNNMLAVVIGNLDLAQKRPGDAERVTRLLANARTGAERAVDLTKRLLAFSRRQPLTPEPIDTGALVRGMSDLLTRTLGEGVRLETDADPDVWPVEADRSQLENAILNLAINGRDAMPGGGVVRITARNLPAGHDGREADEVCVAVTDTGEGMSEAVAARALEPFFTTKEVGKGTGLGLSQVYGYVTQSGGRLTIRSAPGEGTTVQIVLPRADARPAHAGPLEGPPAPARGEVVLLVEDEDQVREATAALLREAGYTVLEAADGRAGLRLLQRGATVDLMLCDAVMPGLSGRETVEAARRLRPGLRVLFTSGYTREAEALTRIAPLLPKPFGAAELARAVRERLDA